MVPSFAQFICKTKMRTFCTVMIFGSLLTRRPLLVDKSWTWFSAKLLRFWLPFRAFFDSQYTLDEFEGKKSVFTFQNQNILSTTLQLQGHKGRCVHFGTCVKYFIFNASCELHRPAFMTLEPIRWHCKFCWELRNDEYNNNIKLITNTTTWRESLTNLAEMNNFWGFGQNVDQYRSGLHTYRHPLLSMQ